MSTATVLNSVITESTIPYIIVEYSIDNIAGDSTSDLIELELPSITLSDYSHRNIPNTKITGESYIINLIGLSISCESSKYDISILNKNNINLLETIYESVKIVSINKYKIDFSFDNHIIRNRDDNLVNKLYLFINNRDIISTDEIKFELTYISLQNRTF